MLTVILIVLEPVEEMFCRMFSTVLADELKHIELPSGTDSVCWFTACSDALNCSIDTPLF